jgi:hypothetical protein
LYDVFISLSNEHGSSKRMDYVKTVINAYMNIL